MMRLHLLNGLLRLFVEVSWQLFNDSWGRSTRMVSNISSNHAVFGHRFWTSFLDNNCRIWVIFITYVPTANDHPRTSVCALHLVTHNSINYNSWWLINPNTLIDPSNPLPIVINNLKTFFKSIFDVIDVNWVDTDWHFIRLILVQLIGYLSLSLLGIRKNLSTNSIEVLKEILRIEFLSSRKKTVHISRNHIHQSFHPILIVKTQLFLICLHLPLDLLFFSIVKFVDEIQGLLPGLRNKVRNSFSFGMDRFYHTVLHKMKLYNTTFFLFKGRDACSKRVLHLGVSWPDVLVLRNCSFLDMSLSMGADASSAKSNVALFWVNRGVQCVQ